ncbi:hypothetical protein [Rothia nasimurium]|uniref:hypothetical protein n=1 Tax=Rothia nasimurium TaxID=85336 RepID=UPI003BA27102
MRNLIKETNEKIAPKEYYSNSPEIKFFIKLFWISFIMRLAFFGLVAHLLNEELSNPGSTDWKPVVLFIFLASAAHTAANYPGIRIKHDRTPLQKIVHTFCDTALMLFCATLAINISKYVIIAAQESQWDIQEIVALIFLLTIIAFFIAASAIFHTSFLAISHAQQNDPE